MWLLVVVVALLLAPPARAGGNSLDLPAPFHQALDELRNGKYRQTEQMARNLEKSFPGHPLPFLLVAEANWGLIFCQTGHINSREIWNEAEQKASPFDHDFFEATDNAINSSEKMRRSRQSEALGFFYDGLAHAVRARLYTLRAQALKAGLEGKQMRASLLEALAKDPSLEPDADAGLGVYNYYADVLSPIIKVFRIFLLLPGGDREKGLQQLQTAAEKSTLLVTESANELAKILAYRENRPADAFRLFGKLAEQYPENAIFLLSAANQAERIGDKEAAADYARKALLAAPQMDDVCRAQLEPAAQQALDRIHKN
jgi:hypothetical protein